MQYTVAWCDIKSDVFVSGVLGVLDLQLWPRDENDVIFRLPLKIQQPNNQLILTRSWKSGPDTWPC